MSPEEFELFRELVERESGIVMKGDSRMAFHTKISHRLDILGISSYTDYYNAIDSDPSGEELSVLISHIANNETFFLRETAQVNAFEEILGEVKRDRHRRREKKINILSAGCSSGEEPYTLNIKLIESGHFAWGWDVRVVGMDISRNVLKKARSAVYGKNSFRLLDGSGEFTSKYFEERDGRYSLKKLYRSNVEFRHGNILHPGSFEDMEAFDVIFCRNVFIYMGDDSVRRAAENFYESLREEGYLFIGASETLFNKTDLFVPEYREGFIVYRKNPRHGP